MSKTKFKLSKIKLFKCDEFFKHSHNTTTYKCDRVFKTEKGLTQHKVRVHPHPRVKFNGVVTFLSLVDGPNWERVFNNEKDLKNFKSNPDNESLQLGISFRILEVLQDIRFELRKQRTIN